MRATRRSPCWPPSTPYLEPSRRTSRATGLYSGLLTNMTLAAGLVYFGDKLGVDLSIAAIVAFGVRIFNNLGAIRRHYL
ncbi:MAG TPA: small basic family protein [Candidatus Dormibacteraeota bacterium]|nr:small basic family protein [Candidatus Dormibacteraeota bacterium]